MSKRINDKWLDEMQAKVDRRKMLTWAEIATLIDLARSYRAVAIATMRPKP